jgi:hypothetical protein
MSPQPCPECASGKCQNCDSVTLDEATDEFVECPCYHAGHPRIRPVPNRPTIVPQPNRPTDTL